MSRSAAATRGTTPPAVRGTPLAAVGGEGEPGSVTVGGLLGACPRLLQRTAAYRAEPRCRSVQIGIGDRVAGAVVLGVGVLSRDLPEACELLARDGASALVVAGEDIDEAVELAASRADLCLLGLRSGVSWADAFRMIASFLTGASADGLEALIHDGDDLSALVHALGARMGRPLTVETSRGDVVAYSAHAGRIDAPRQQTILSGASPAPILARMRRAGLFRRIDSSDGPVRIVAPELDLTPRVGMAIRDGREVIGYLWVMEQDRSLTAAELALVRQVAPLAAFHLHRHALQIEVDRRIRDELVRDIVQRETTSEELICARAGSIGIDARTTYEVVVVDLDGYERDVLAEPTEARAQDLKRRLREVVGFQARSTDPAAVCASIADSVLVLLPQRRAGSARAGDFAARTLKACRAARPPVRASIGVGRPAKGLVDLPGCYEQAAQAVSVAQRIQGGNTVLAYDSLGVYQMLSNARGVVLSPAVKLLQAYDAKHASEYCRTLSAFLDSFGDRGRTAAALHIHHNTLAYRLKRIRDLTGLELRDPEARLAAQLQLRALQLAGFPTGMPTPGEGARH